MIFGRYTGTTSDIPKDAQSRHTNQRLLERVELMKAAVERLMAATQKRCENNFDKKAHQKPQIRDGDEVYIDCLQYAASASDSAEEFALKRYSKLMRRTCKPHTVTKV